VFIAVETSLSRGTVTVINEITYYSDGRGNVTVNGGTVTVTEWFYKYSGGNARFYGGTLNIGTSGSYEFMNYGNLYVVSGTVTVDKIANNSGGLIEHSGGTIEISEYYKEAATGCHYYGSGSAIFYFTWSSYIRLYGTGVTSYFNDVNIDDAYYIETGSTQDFDINGKFTISSGNSFDTNGRAMFVAGNWTNDGTFTHDNNTVTFDGGSAQTILGTATTSFYDVHITNSAGLNLNSSTNAKWDHEITFGSDVPAVET